MICKICGREIEGSLYVYRKEWDTYWHYRCYRHDKRVSISLPISCIKFIRDKLLKDSDRSIEEDEFLYATSDI